MSEIQKYFQVIGRRGGLKSRRRLDSDAARQMVRIREARRAFRRFRTSCFWSYRPDLAIGAAEVAWVADQLRKHGNREAWRVAARLCRCPFSSGRLLAESAAGTTADLLRSG